MVWLPIVHSSNYSIILVKIRWTNRLAAVQNYAFLDPGSSETFCTEDLMQRLGTQGRQLKIKLQTISQSRDVFKHAVLDTEVTNLEGRHVV
jgi:hypothetical protein